MQVMLALGATALLASLVSAPAAPAGSSAPSGLTVTSVSNPHPDLVSSDQVLVRVSRSDVRVTRDGADVTSVFARQPDGTLLGLVTGLHDGRNDIVARGARDRADLVVTDHPSTGPVFSGPQQE